MKYFRILILIGLLCSEAFVLKAQNLKENKRIVRTYRLTDQQIIEINNKYGKVEIINWDKDSVRFVINFSMSAKTPEKLKKLESLLNFNFAVSEYYIRATTLVGSSATSIKSEIDNITNAFMTIGAEVIIDYTVYLPSKNRMKIKNSFGDILMGNTYASLDIQLSHGDLRVADLFSFVNLELKFGKAFISSMTEGAINCQFSTLNLEKAQQLNLISKSSNISLSDVRQLEIDSRRDLIELKRVNTIKGKLYFTRMTIYRLESDLSLETDFGALSMEMISKMFDNIRTKSNYTDLTMIFETGSSFSLSMEHAEISFSYPQNLASLNTQLINKDSKQYRTNGSFGESNNQKSNVLITANKGSLKILFR